MYKLSNIKKILLSFIDFVNDNDGEMYVHKMQTHMETHTHTHTLLLFTLLLFILYKLSTSNIVNLIVYKY